MHYRSLWVQNRPIDHTSFRGLTFSFYSRPLQYVIRSLLHKDDNSSWQKLLQSIHFFRDLSAKIWGLPIRDVEDILVTSKWSAGENSAQRGDELVKRVTDGETRVTDGETRVIDGETSYWWCQKTTTTKSPYEIDIKSTTRSIANLFLQIMLLLLFFVVF